MVDLQSLCLETEFSTRSGGKGEPATNCLPEVQDDIMGVKVIQKLCRAKPRSLLLSMTKGRNSLHLLSGVASPLIKQAHLPSDGQLCPSDSPGS